MSTMNVAIEQAQANEAAHREGRRQETLRERLASLRDQRGEYLSDVILGNNEHAKTRVAELDAEILAVRTELGDVEPEPEASPAPALGRLELRAQAARRELDELAGRRGALALSALGDGDEQSGAAHALGKLDAREVELQLELRRIEYAQAEVQRIDAEAAARSAERESARLAAASDEADKARDDALRDLSVECRGLVKVALNSQQKIREAEAAAFQAGRTPPRFSHHPVSLITSWLQQSGIRVSDLDVPLAAERARILELYSDMSSTRCSVCQHPEREAVEAALEGGETQRSTATRFKLSQAALVRHLASHKAATAA